MRLKDVFTAIREYPGIHAALEHIQGELESAHRDLQKMKRDCEQLNSDWGAQQYKIDAAERRTEALSAALAAFCPKLSTAEEMRRFYECVGAHLDPEGFKLYFAAQAMTGFKAHEALPFEDARGQFEEADGHQLMGYLLADQFGAVDWDIVPGTSYERATLGDVDKTTPEYRAFEKGLYKKVLRKMGFGDLLPPEPEKEKGRLHAPEKKEGDAR